MFGRGFESRRLHTQQADNQQIINQPGQQPGQRPGQNHPSRIESLMGFSVKVMVPYKPAQVYHTEKEWFVYFSYWSLSSRKYIREKVRLQQIGLDEKTRAKALKNLCDEINVVIRQRNRDLIYHESIQNAKANITDGLVKCALVASQDEELKQDRRDVLQALSGHLEGFEKKHPAFAGSTAFDLSDVYLRLFIKYLRDIPLSGKSINKYLWGVEKVTEWLKSQQLTDKIYTTEHLHVEQPKNESGRFPPLTHDEKVKAFDFYKSRSAEDYLFLLHVYYTCIRPAELHRIQIKHINLIAKTIHTPWFISKNGLSNYVQILEPLLFALQDYDIKRFPPNYYLFGNYCKPSATKYVGEYSSKTWLRSRELMGMPFEKQMYGLKHTFNVDYVENNKYRIEWEWLRRHNRHATVQQTQQYISGLTAYFLDETKSVILNYYK